MTASGARPPAPALGAGLLGVAALAVGSLAPDLAMAPRAWLLLAGFLAIAAGLAIAPRRSFTPLAIALIFVVYGGLSALVAIPQTAEGSAETARSLSKDEVRASTPAKGYKVLVDEESFAYAAKVTSLAGVCAILAALLVLRGARRERRAPLRSPLAHPQRLEWVGKGLVIAGFAGVLLALIRFLSTQLPTDDLWDSAKSFWIGGSYFLLLATFAVPGFGLWLQGLLARGAWGRRLAPLAAVMAVYLLLLLPTGQRGFVIAICLMVLAVLVFNGRLAPRAFAALAVVGVVAIGLTQAARNVINDTGGFDTGEYVERLAPNRWEDLYGSQLASFNWTALIEENRDRLDIPNSFSRALLKPVPRQIYPEKSQGFGTEFTRRMFPEAAEQQVSFATPLTAETDYFYGPLGVVLVFTLLGGLAAFAESRILAFAARIVWPIAFAALAWTVFVLYRGDLANALVVASGWLIPLLLVSRAVGLRQPARVKKILIDALQVAPEFSGIGRRIAELGRDFKSRPPAVPLRVRCAKDVQEDLRPEFPANTEFEAPLSSSRPRSLRIAYQQLVGPLRDSASTLLVCPGDQAPVWGRAPVVFIVHDVRRVSMPQTAESRAERLYYRLSTRAGVMRAAEILTISEFSRDELHRHFEPQAPVGIVVSRIEPRSVSPGAGDRIGSGPPLSDSAPQLLAVGALRSYKGLETLIEALGRLAERGVPVPRTVCVGADESGSGYPDRLRAMAAERGVGEYFEIRGWVADAELARLYAESTASVSPSEFEGFGLPVAEGLAAGLPVIASSIPPHREVAGDAALYFEPGNADELAAAIERLMGDGEQRERLRAIASRRVSEIGRDSPTWAEAIGAAARRLSSEEAATTRPAGSPAEEAAPTGSPSVG